MPVALLGWTVGLKLLIIIVLTDTCGSETVYVCGFPVVPRKNGEVL
jgi:hypothetical protein